MATRAKPLPERRRCPFCGSKGEVGEAEGKRPVDPLFKTALAVSCANDRCCCEGPLRMTERGAIVAWNRRA